MAAHGSRAALVGLALLLAAACSVAAAAKKEAASSDDGYSDSHWNWDVWYGDMKPYKGHKYRHDYWYLVPKEPRAVVLLVHGCVHSGYNWFPQSEECDECRGLPEEMSHTLQALRRSYAVVAVSSLDRETGCFQFWEDFMDVIQILDDFRQEWGLKDVPLYGVGVSAGAAFLLKMPRYIKFDGLVAEALGVDPKSGAFDVLLNNYYPPTVFVSMERDEKQKEFIRQDREIIEKLGSPVEVVKVYPRKVYPTYFSDRNPYYVTPKLSQKIWRGLLEIDMIDRQGNILEDPRYTPRPWLKSLQDVVPELGRGGTEEVSGYTVPKFPDSSENVVLPGIWSLMNLAYAAHEIISDYTTAAFMWFEGGTKKGHFQYCLDWYTYGLPPPPPPPPSPSPPPPAPLEPPAPAPDAADLLTGSVAAKDVGISGPEEAPAPAPVPVPAVATPGAVEPASTSESNEESGGSSSNMAAIVGGAVGGAAAVLLLGGLAWWLARRRRGGAPAGAGTAVHPHPHMHHHGTGTAHVSIVPHVKDRFDLTEIVEQTGSPYSARRRVKTAFQSDSPMRRGGTPRGPF